MPSSENTTRSRAVANAPFKVHVDKRANDVVDRKRFFRVTKRRFENCARFRKRVARRLSNENVQNFLKKKTKTINQFSRLFSFSLSLVVKQNKQTKNLIDDVEQARADASDVGRDELHEHRQ